MIYVDASLLWTPFRSLDYPSRVNNGNNQSAISTGLVRDITQARELPKDSMPIHAFNCICSQAQWGLSWCHTGWIKTWFEFGPPPSGQAGVFFFFFKFVFLYFLSNFLNAGSNVNVQWRGSRNGEERKGGHSRLARRISKNWHGSRSWVVFTNHATYYECICTYNTRRFLREINRSHIFFRCWEILDLEACRVGVFLMVCMYVCMESSELVEQVRWTYLLAQNHIEANHDLKWPVNQPMSSWLSNVLLLPVSDPWNDWLIIQTLVLFEKRRPCGLYLIWWSCVLSMCFHCLLCTYYTKLGTGWDCLVHSNFNTLWWSSARPAAVVQQLVPRFYCIHCLYILLTKVCSQAGLLTSQTVLRM